MDQQKLRNLVFEKTGVRIDVDDPVFALVALNEAVLAEAVERHVALLDNSTRALAARLQDAGLAGAAPRPIATPGSGSDLGSGAGFDLGSGSASGSDSGLGSGPRSGSGFVPGPQEKRSIAIAAGAAVLGALLVLSGQAIFFKPPAPAPVMQARELTEAQSNAIRDGEKLAKVVRKLDAKTRNTIQAELQKP